MIPIVTPAEMRAIDDAADEPVEELIARAGWRVATAARRMLGGVYGRRVVALAGPGNNGADARVAALLLNRWGAAAMVLGPGASSIPAADLVIDGAFGTGISRAYVPPVPPQGARVLAVDIPSGVDGLTGERVGEPLQADETVTFAALKPGLLLPPGAQLSGTVTVADIGLDTTSAGACLLTQDDVQRLLPRREVDAHKWRRSVWVVGGSAGMYGAPLLAAQAALRAGTGMVWCGLPGMAPPAIASEVVFRTLPARGWHADVLPEAERFGSLVVGCGLAESEAAANSTRALIDETDMPLVLDGGALRLLGTYPALRSNIVLTPHDGEFTALTGERPGADRFAAARDLAQRTGATILLKGPLTIVAAPDGRCLAANRGDQRLATPGTGDVLAGTVGAMLAGSLEPAEAAAVAAWLHGESGRTQASVGMVASDLLSGLSQVMSGLTSNSSHGGTGASN